MKRSSLLALGATLLGGMGWGSEDAGRQKRQREYDLIRTELDGIEPEAGADPAAVALYLAAVKEKLGKFAEKHRGTGEGFDAAVDVASLLLNTGDLEGARKYLDLALQNQPRDAPKEKVLWLWAHLASLRAVEGQIKEAAAALEEAEELGAPARDLLSFYQLIIQMAARAGEIQEGRRLLERLKGTDAKVEAQLKSALDAVKVAVGDAPSPLEVTDLAGRKMSLAAHQGKVILVDFWATWCDPCRQELPHLKKVYQEHRDEGLVILGISLDDDKEKLTSFIKENDIPWQNHSDFKGWENELAAKWGVSAIPQTFLIGKSGKVCAVGARGERLAARIKQLLAEKVPPK